MFFRRKIQKSCAYCSHGTKLNDEQILCIKRGVVAITGKCRKFDYAPCKRIPVKAKVMNFEKYDEEDFSL